MKDLQFAPEVDPAITKACDSFLAQVRALVSVDGLVVVLLEQAVGRLVFVWEGSDKVRDAAKTSGPVGPHVTHKESPPACITLKGSDGVVGAVLIRGTPLGNSGSIEPNLVQSHAEHLGTILENILLLHRLERNAKESTTLERIGGLVSCRSPVEQVYRLFANEILGLIDYQRLSVFLAQQNSAALTCAYWTGPGVVPDELKVTRALTGTGCEVVVSQGQSIIVGDLQEDSDFGWPEFGEDVRLRSAVIVPVVYGKDAVGVVALENRFPAAYGPLDEKLLLRAATLLGPAIANPSHNSQLASQDDERGIFNRLAQTLASNRRLDEVFEDYALAAGKLIEFDRMTLAWLDPNGCDILSLRSFSGASHADEALEVGFLTSIQTTLKFGRHDIGTLTLWRRRDELFIPEDVLKLERLGIQVAATVQNDRLYRLGQCQAYQLSQAEDAQALSHPKEGAQFDSLRQEFLVDRAHSLRSPLSSIKGYSSTLLQPDVSWPPEVRREFLETIDREADQLNLAINDLLGSMESESSTVQLDRSLLPVQGLLRMAEAELVGEQGIPIWFQCEPNLPPVLVDEIRIAQVIVYLASCAHRAASSGATLTVHARLKKKHIRISVGFAHDQTVVGEAIKAPRPQTMQGRNLVPTWVHRELMLSVCQTVLLAHGVDLCHGTVEMAKEVFWFDLPEAPSQHRDGVTSS